MRARRRKGSRLSTRAAGAQKGRDLWGRGPFSWPSRGAERSRRGSRLRRLRSRSTHRRGASGRYVLGGLRLVRGDVLGLLLALDALVDFFPMDGDVLGRVDADANLISLDPQNRDGHVVTDHDGFTDPSSENEHLPIPLLL